MSLDPEIHQIRDFFTLIDDTHNDLFSMDGRKGRDSEVESFVVDHSGESTILGDTRFIDLQIRHDLESGDDLLVEKCLVF